MASQSNPLVATNNEGTSGIGVGNWKCIDKRKALVMYTFPVARGTNEGGGAVGFQTFDLMFRFTFILNLSADGQSGITSNRSIAQLNSNEDPLNPNVGTVFPTGNVEYQRVNAFLNPQP